MATPMTQVERRLEELEKGQKKIVAAVETMAEWLVQAQTGFNANDAQGIKKVLRDGDEGKLPIRT